MRVTHLIGVDVGTTSCKTALYTRDFECIARSGREYTIQTPEPGWAEQDAEQIWTLVLDTLREVIGERQIRAAVSFSVQGEAVIPVDSSGNAIRPAILGMDTRTTVQNNWLRENLGARSLYDRTGMPIHTINSLPKLLWLKEHEPDVWATTYRFLLYEDFLINKMTGQAVISECLASRTQLYDTRAGCWSAEILAALGLEPDRLARIEASGSSVETMRPDLAESLGFTEPPLIVTGGHDQACGALGIGLVTGGLAMVSTGTAEVIEVAIEGPPALNDSLFNANISFYRHVVPGQYLAMTLNHSGGLLLRWFRDIFCESELAQARRDNRNAYDLILYGATPDPSPLLVLPHFAGSGTPSFDTQSKGAVLGLTFSTTRADFAKAILEGLTFELKLNLDLLQASGISIRELRAIGGGARSDLWTQLKADITGIPVIVPPEADAACFGAALLAGQGAKLYASAAKVTETQFKVRRRIFPDPDRVAGYEKRFALYREVYPAVVAISHRL